MRSTFRYMLCFVLVPLLMQPAASAVSAAPRQTKPYHGMRIMPEKIDFYVWKITTADLSTNQITIDISFSRAVDPRTLKPQMILRGTIPLAADTPVQYTRAGTACRIQVPRIQTPDIPFTFEFDGVKSIEGRPLLQKTFTGITFPKTILFAKPAAQEIP